MHNRINLTPASGSKEIKPMKKLIFAIVALAIAFVSQAQLPSVKLRDINGQTVDTSTLSNDGKPMIVSFFATWCKPCLRELKAINDVYEEWQEETGVRLVAISIDEGQNSSKVRPLAEGEGWEYQVLLDPNGEMKRALGIQMIPFVMVLDGQGNIVYQHNGYTDGGEEELIAKVRELAK